MAFWAAIGSAVIGAGASAYGAKKDRDASADNQSQSQSYLSASSQRAREDAGEMFGHARAARTAGFDTSRDIFQQFVPQQVEAFQQGNYQAQGTVGGTAQQQMNAIMGQPMDFSFLQPQQAYQPDYSFMDFDTPIPEVAPSQREEESAAITDQIDEAVYSAYRQYLGREPDPGGLSYYRSMVGGRHGLAGPGGVSDMIKDIKGSKEGKLYRQSQNTIGQTGQQGFGQFNNPGGVV